MIYFDNAATSGKKPNSVIRATSHAIKCLSANPGRSGHKKSIMAAKKITQAREAVAKFFGANNYLNVIFTKNCTEALNYAIFGVLKKGDHVIASCFEHNSVLRPLNFLVEQKIITISIITPKNKISGIVLDDILPFVTLQTKMICLTHISNVTGNINDIGGIGNYCAKNNILFLVDGAQSAGHIKINVEKDNINYFCFAGHKGLFAPQSIGGLVVNAEDELMPRLYGGTGTNSLELNQPQELPERLESGTLSTPQIMGLQAGIKYAERHFEKITKKIKLLTSYLLHGLENNLNVKVYTNRNSKYGVVAFNIKNISCSDVCDILNEKFNIAVRSGLHCAPLAHKFLGTLKTNGAIRVSLNHFNTRHQVKIFLKAIKKIISQKQK